MYLKLKLSSEIQGQLRKSDLCLQEFSKGACTLYSRAAQNFWGLIPQTPNWKLAQNVKVYQVSSPSEVVLPRPQSPEDDHQRPSLEVSQMTFLYWLRGSADVVKRPPMDLKLGIPSRFGPISSLEFEE